MIFFAKFRDEEAAGFVVDAAGPEAAVDKVVDLCGEEPAHLVPMPPGLFAAEVRFADPAAEEDDSKREEWEPSEHNPGEHTSSGIALDPFEGLAEWLAAADEMSPPSSGTIGTASTMPAPPEEEEEEEDAL